MKSGSESVKKGERSVNQIENKGEGMQGMKTFWHFDENNDSWVRKSSKMGPH